MRLLKRMTASRWFQVAVGVLAAEYLRLVWKTNRFVIEPPNGYEQFDADPPGIAVFWHGQHLMTPFLSRRHRVKVIISRHRDGEINAIAAERLGIGTIRGSGSHSGDFLRKGGPRAFRAIDVSTPSEITLRRTCCTRRCARRSKIPCIRRVRSLHPIDSASTLRITVR